MSTADKAASRADRARKPAAYCLRPTEPRGRWKPVIAAGRKGKGRILWVGDINDNPKTRALEWALAHKTTHIVFCTPVI